ncbi:MAG: alpha-2-macroglobulin family protein, partial [Candidatus Omnitrophota bacterium]
VSDKDKKPVSAEVLTLMYDRSLEYYFSSQYPWLNELYNQRLSLEYNYGFDSAKPMTIYQVPVTEGVLQKILKSFEQPLEDFQIPGLRSWQTWPRSRKTRGLQGRLKSSSDDIGDMNMSAAYGAPKAVFKAKIDNLKEAESAAQSNEGGEKILQDKKLEEKSLNSEGLVATRREFADTAFFKPHIVTSPDGKASFSLKVPEQLTAWKVKAFAFTKDVQEATATQEAVTRKDLMVRIDVPRFFREKDKGTITVFVHNEGKELLKGQLKLEVSEEGVNINSKIKVKDNSKEFSVEPHAQKSIDWAIEIPSGVTTYKVRAQAVSGKLTDAEERPLPILPSRERLTESRFVSLTGNVAKKMEINLNNDPTRINESMTLQVDPQLFLTVMNTIPFLVQYPHECVEQTLNKYVPLAIMHQVYEKHPEVKQAVSKIPKRSTPLPAWEKDDPNRLMKLMETPWMWESQGRPTIWPIIDMLEPSTVKAKESESLEKLRNAQLPSGAFPWWSGGAADPYMTLYVLDGFAQARRYGVEVPRDMIDRALSYVNQEIPLRLKPEAYELSLIAMASYVVTSYPENEFP